MRIADIAKTVYGLGDHRFHIFSFYQTDFLPLALDLALDGKKRGVATEASPDSQKERNRLLFESIQEFVRKQVPAPISGAIPGASSAVASAIDQIFFLGNIRSWGKFYNPVCFFYCYSKGCLVFIVAQVTNTYGEKQAYLVPYQGERGEARLAKNLYVSPFISREGEFIFDLSAAGESILLRISSRARARRRSQSQKRSQEPEPEPEKEKKSRVAAMRMQSLLRQYCGRV